MEISLITTVCIVLILGIALNILCTKLKIPSLIGYLLLGIILGNSQVNVIDESTLSLSAEIRRLALAVILIRGGLSLDITDLMKIGRPALLMSFIPAICEITGIFIVGSYLLGLSHVESLILGAVIAAVSPAVIVPSMIKIMNENYGNDKKVCQLVLASASLDDIFVIILFSSFLSLGQGGELSLSSLAMLPVSVILGGITGFGFGYFISFVANKVKTYDITKTVLLYIGISSLLLIIEDLTVISGLIGIMAMSITVNKLSPKLAKEMSGTFKNVWVLGEMLLFVLVGLTVDISYAVTLGIVPIIVVIVGLLFRMMGVYLSLLKTKLDNKERLFCMMSFMPKATVQASIGGIPLAVGLGCGDIVLTVAVVSILLTAPVGAFIIDRSYRSLLKK